MTEMVERVARAIYDTDPFSGAVYDSEPEYYKEPFRVQARAAIEAIREMTDHMVETAWETRMADPQSWWSDIIDSALNEQVSG